jgi:predicted hydrolase (HD superfamily)
MRLQAEELGVALHAALEMPVSAATERTLQWVEPLAGLVCRVVLIRPATRS